MSRTTKLLLEHLRLQMDGKPSMLPAGGQLLWRWFLDLCRTRTYSQGAGPNPFSYAEIDAYGRLYRWPIEGRHVDVLLNMDRLWMERARAGIAGGNTGPGQPMTADAFDAVFV